MAAPSSPSQQTLRQLRQARSWTQLDVAVRLGVDRGTVSTWERGVYLPQPHTWQRLADLFGVGVGDVAFGQDEKQP